MTTKIGWTDETWNPVTGCTKCSPGCKNCYAEPIALKFQKRGILGYEKGFRVKCHPKRLRTPFKWLKPRKVFVNSMSDLFHPDVPDEFIFEIFAVMNKCPQHIFQVLTKRPERMAYMNDKLLWTPNIWAGVSVENIDETIRVTYLSTVDAKIKFISFEPLLGKIFDDWNPNNRIYLPEDGPRFYQSALYFYMQKYIDWVIVGGESGTNPRTMKEYWAVRIKEICSQLEIPFFFKQMGGRGHSKGGNLLSGLKYEEYPGKILSGQDQFKLEYGQEFVAEQPGNKSNKGVDRAR